MRYQHIEGPLPFFQEPKGESGLKARPGHRARGSLFGAGAGADPGAWPRSDGRTRSREMKDITDAVGERLLAALDEAVAAEQKCVRLALLLAAWI